MGGRESMSEKECVNCGHWIPSWKHIPFCDIECWDESFEKLLQGARNR